MNTLVSKILIIEDNEILRSSLLEILTFEGYSVRGAENGLSGLHQIYQFRPNLVICDIMMPEMDGYEVLKNVREMLGMSEVRFIFLSAMAQHEDLRRGMETGADDFLTKPFSTADLMTCIRQQITKQHAQQAATEHRLDELRGQLISALPHELRTPLTTIVGFIDLLLDTQDDIDATEFKDIMWTMRDASQRMWRLVENYVIYSQIMLNTDNQQWRQTLHSQSVADPKDVVADEARKLATLHNRTCDLKIALLGDGNLAISEDHLRKIVYELVDNAFKFSESGQPVFVNTRQIDTQFWIEITDCGRGIKPEQIEKIGAYTQFDRARYEQQGSGLGLTIARLLTKLYGGTLSIESQLKGPTVVSVLLDSVPESQSFED